MKVNRTYALLAALALVLGFVALRQWMPGLGAPAVAAGVPGKTERSTKKGKGMITAADVPVVVAGLAHPRGNDVFQRERSLFDFAQSPEEIQAKKDADQAAAEAAKRAAELARIEAERRAKEKAEKDAAEAAARARQAALQAEFDKQNPPKPVPPSFPYQYVGTIGPPADPYAIMTGPDRAFHYARVGDVIDDKFKLEYIAEARLDLSFTDPRFTDQFTQVQRTFETASASRPR